MPPRIGRYRIRLATLLLAIVPLACVLGAWRIWLRPACLERAAFYEAVALEKRDIAASPGLTAYAVSRQLSQARSYEFWSRLYRLAVAAPWDTLVSDPSPPPRRTGAAPASAVSPQDPVGGPAR